MTLEGIEVAVAMKKFMAFGNAKRRDNRVDGAARRHAARSERAVIAGCGKSDFMATHRAKFERSENAHNTQKVGFGCEALQHFGHDQIADNELRRWEMTKRISLGSRTTVEVVDPYRGIDDDHLRGLRSRRMALRSPSQ